MSFISLLFILLSWSPQAHAGVLERIWTSLESALGLEQVVVTPRDIVGHDGRTYPPSRQLMVTLQAGEGSGDSARADLFYLVSQWLNRAYPDRPVIPLQATNGVGFSRAWDIARNSLGTTHRNSTVTQFVLLVDQEIEVVEDASGRNLARLSIDGDAFEIPVSRDLKGEWQLVPNAAGNGELFRDLRGRFAQNAQAIIFMQDARGLLNRDRHLSEQVVHQFYGKLLGLNNAELYIGRPFAGAVGQFVVTQLARRGISRLLLGGVSLALAAYFVPDAGDFVLTALIAGSLYVAEGLLQRNAGRGHISQFESGDQVSYEFALDYTTRKSLLLQAEACRSALIRP